LQVYRKNLKFENVPEIFQENSSSAMDISVLVNSGLDASLISADLVQNLELKEYHVTLPIDIEVIDSSKVSSSKIQSYVFLTLIHCKYPFYFKYFVLPNLHLSIVLGLDWLSKFNPIINLNTLSFILTNF
jgi:hypothetical protein